MDNREMTMLKQGFKYFFLAAAIAFIIGCERHPFKKTSTLADEGLLPSVSPVFIVYDDEIKTGGNLFTFPGGENQVVSLDEADNPVAGKRCIRYTWNGGDVHDDDINAGRHDFAGLNLPVSQGDEDFDEAAAVNLTSGGYGTLTFWIRGVLTQDVTVKVEAVDDGDEDTAAPFGIYAVSSVWEKKELSLAGADLSSVKEFFKITFIYTQPIGTDTPGRGGTIFIDDIQLEQ